MITRTAPPTPTVERLRFLERHDSNRRAAVRHARTVMAENTGNRVLVDALLDLTNILTGVGGPR